jgi:hypothetical protein
LSLPAGVASAVPTAKPMLGTKPYPDTVGFGQVKPTRLGFGKDVVCHIHWDSWGGQIALGTGDGWAVSAVTYKRIPSVVIVYLYKLKTVHGKLAYTALNWQPVPTQHAHALKLC